ncbi:P-loop containing nucleoside triphosphate hydrolase protein [Halteromyces radiatus]|uniref:P-loop containing nucleoside triphosphate hydrolase protein n=1 Tax=Halteromyces radiatus TaxID=101107 RepID=UPI00221F2A4C|nr:P-loop containing nucleoside triphosphate hydrolase protein [Halteromyces radiatus]KAI8086422.1 P-loop containing nucleoside triphosphate hydrolase protein [Halteromyces radiatus]
MVTNNKQSKEDIQVLRKMGIPEWLLQPTMVTPDQSCSLDSVGLSPSLVMRCQDQGLSSFFAVQMKVIPAFLRRQTFYDTRRAPGDLCISAPTGSGKTLAYVLPIVDILSKRRVTRLRALIVLPTRDLVIQVKETFDAFVQGTDLKVGIALGQHSLSQEQSGLVGKTDQIYEGGLSKVDILIATPGRLMDHLKMTPNFTLQHLRFLVIDEADRLLNQSYQDWLNHILQSTQPQTNKDKSGLTFKTDPFGVIESDAVAPSFMSSCFDLPISDIDLPKAPAVQKLLFSATLTKDPGKIAGLHLTDPEYISVQHDNDETNQPQYTTPAGLKEYMLTCPSAKKPLFLIYLLHHLKIKSGLCFTKSVESTRQLQILLAAYVKQQELDINVVVYSSDLKPAQRKSLLKEFKEGKINLMICSDLIGRGIDLDCVEVVISYDVPLFMDKYIHRVGRTARAGRNGQAFTLVETQEARHFKEMIRKAGHSQQLERFIVDKEQMQTFEEGYQSALAETSQDD